MPQVSVVIPAFNAASTIATALESVSAQTFQDLEIIVVDDGSTDGTADIAQRAAPHALVIRQANAGPGAARNAAIARASGHFVGFLDADDLWFPDKLAHQIRYFQRYPDAGFVHAETLILPSAARPNTSPQSVEQIERAPAYVFCELFHIGIIINTLTVLVPRQVLLDVGGFDERRQIHVEDWDLYLRIAAKYPIGYQPLAVGIHRVGGVMSSAVEKTYMGQAAVIEKNIHLCALACGNHRRSPSPCLDRRYHQLHYELGTLRMRTGAAAEARESLARALRHRPGSVRTLVRYLTTYLPQTAVRSARKFRSRFARSTDMAMHPAQVLIDTSDDLLAENLTRLEELSRQEEMLIEYRSVFSSKTPSLTSILRTLGDAGVNCDISISPTRLSTDRTYQHVMIHGRRTRAPEAPPAPVPPQTPETKARA